MASLHPERVTRDMRLRPFSLSTLAGRGRASREDSCQRPGVASGAESVRPLIMPLLGRAHLAAVSAIDIRLITASFGPYGVASGTPNRCAVSPAWGLGVAVETGSERTPRAVALLD